MKKSVCTECGWHGQTALVLTANNPFCDGDIIYGCPECKEVNTIVQACDESGCWKRATCGTPTEHRYRMTCGKHKP